MISILVSAFLGATAPQLPWGERITRYENCVRAKANQYERAGETINRTIEAAFGACSIERAAIKLLVLDVQSKQPEMTAAQQKAGEDAAFADIDGRLREELTTSLFEKRSAGK